MLKLVLHTWRYPLSAFNATGPGSAFFVVPGCGGHIKDMMSFGRFGATNETFLASHCHAPQTMFIVGIIYGQVCLPKTIHKPSVERNYK